MKSLIAIICILGIVGIIAATSVKAADTATVAATVTVQNISVSVSDGSINYGVLALSSTKSTCDLSDTQILTNDGNVPEIFNIKGNDSANWTLGATAGANVYVHKFSANACPWATGTGTALTTNYQTLASAVPAGGASNLNLQINTPTSSTSFAPQSVDVTILAIMQ